MKTCYMKNTECDSQTFNFSLGGIIFMFQGLMYTVKDSVFISLIQCRICSPVYTINIHIYTYILKIIQLSTLVPQNYNGSRRKIHITIINTVTVIIKVRLLQARYDSF